MSGANHAVEPLTNIAKGGDFKGATLNSLIAAVFS